SSGWRSSRSRPRSTTTRCSRCSRSRWSWPACPPSCSPMARARARVSTKGRDCSATRGRASLPRLGGPPPPEADVPADEPSNERLLVVSCDSHADPGDAADYAPYFEPRYRELFVRSTAAIAGVDDRDTGAEMFSRDHVERRAHAFETFLEGIEERDGGLDRRLAHGDTMRSMTVDAATRIRELEADGVVAEVVFPNALPFQYVPEISRFGPELRAAGLRAYNRWLADLCAESPGRTVGVAQLPAVDDVEATVREIRASAAAGLRGVQCPRPAAGRPPLSDASYEPIWQSCVELALPLHVHIGWGGSNVDGLPPDAARDPAVGAIMRSEIRWLSRRPLWLLIWGQVLERHPE